MTALIVLWIGLLGAGSPALACASAAAAGDCCPASAPSGCSQAYEEFDLAATACCVTSSAPSAVVFAERSRESQFIKHDCGSADPVVNASAFGSLPYIRPSSGFAAAIVRSAATDRSLTYLQTGRLRL